MSTKLKLGKKPSARTRRQSLEFCPIFDIADLDEVLDSTNPYVKKIPSHRKLSTSGRSKKPSAFELLKQTMIDEVEVSDEKLFLLVEQWIKKKYPTVWGENGEKWVKLAGSDHLAIVKEALREVEWKLRP